MASAVTRSPRATSWSGTVVPLLVCTREVLPRTSLAGSGDSGMRTYTARSCVVFSTPVTAPLIGVVLAYEPGGHVRAGRSSGAIGAWVKSRLAPMLVARRTKSLILDRPYLSWM